MNYRILLRQKLLKKQVPDFQQIDNQVNRALKDLKAAEANLAIDLSWAVAIAYHAMIRAGRALIYSRGYLPTARQTHKTIVDVAGVILGPGYRQLIARFNRLRRKRHDFIYDSKNHTTLREARIALETAGELIEKISTAIREENPQGELNLRSGCRPEPPDPQPGPWPGGADVPLGRRTGPAERVYY